MYIRADTNDFSSANALTPALVFVALCSIPSLVAYSICYFVGTVDLMTMYKCNVHVCIYVDGELGFPAETLLLLRLVESFMKEDLGLK